jgi:hypothetical protein
MALDPRTREGLLAGWTLDRQRRVGELLQKRLRQSVGDHLIQQVLEREIWQLELHLALRAVASRSVSNPPAVGPISRARTAEKTTGRETAEERLMLARIPDLVQVITAYRAWRVESVNGQVRLSALGMDVVWEPRQKAEAVCMQWASWKMGRLLSKEACPLEHEAPDFHCCCGIWGFKSIENLRLALGRTYRPSVIGKVSLWGRVIETENGFRAQYAYPEQLWVCEASSPAEELGLVYGVPVRTAKLGDLNTIAMIDKTLCRLSSGRNG